MRGQKGAGEATRPVSGLRPCRGHPVSAQHAPSMHKGHLSFGKVHNIPEQHRLTFSQRT